MVTAFWEILTQTKKPLFLQPDLWQIRKTAARTLAQRRAATRLRRRLTTAEMQLFTLCESILEVVQECPTGNLVLRPSKKLPVEHQLRLSEDAA